MNILFFLIPLSIVLFSVIIWGFFWAVKNDQFENLEAHGLSIFNDEDTVEDHTQSKVKSNLREIK